MTSKAEEVARAIQQARHDAIRDDVGDADAMCARAAIEAMRGATDEMKMHGFNAMPVDKEGWQDAAIVWDEMIDAALTERRTS